mgnify:CR=1 FL=1
MLEGELGKLARFGISPLEGNFWAKFLSDPNLARDLPAVPRTNTHSFIFLLSPKGPLRDCVQIRKAAPVDRHGRSFPTFCPALQHRWRWGACQRTNYRRHGEAETKGKANWPQLLLVSKLKASLVAGGFLSSNVEPKRPDCPKTSKRMATNFSPANSW